MTIETLSIFTAVGILVFFVLGFLFGLSCQSADDRIKTRKLMKTMRRIQENRERWIKEAYELGKKHQKAETQARMDEEWRLFCDSIGQDDQIKFGGF